MPSRFLLILILAVTSCQPPPSPTSPHRLTGQSMGTTWTLLYHGETAPALHSEITAILALLEKTLSTWDPESDLSRYNHGLPATKSLQTVLNLAQKFHLKTNGAFNPNLLAQTSAAGHAPPGLSGTDLSALAKGFAADRVADLIRQKNLPRFVFELGGEIVAGDGPWEVALESPDPARRQIARTLTLENQALATSGNYRQFTLAKNGLASHLIDPATQKPLVRPPSSVTVLAPDCATADAWATALFILGPDHIPPPPLKAIWLPSP